MSCVPYKGETPSKVVTRLMVWLQHERLLKPPAFKTTPHVFLASRVAGDVSTLLSMDVPRDNIWAVEKDHVQYQQLLERRKKEGFRLFPQKVETVVESRGVASSIRSTYLDYCGNLEGTANTTRRVVAQLPPHSVLSVTLFLGREHTLSQNREVTLLRNIREHTPHAVTLVQSILYRSADEDHKGAPMGTWTFYLGPCSSRSRMNFDLTRQSLEEMHALTANKVTTLWRAQVEKALNRSKAAKQANVTRSP